jgi:hypothetical protein
LIAELCKAGARSMIDRRIWIGRKKGPALALRVVAVKKPAQAAAEARRKARRNAHQISKQTLAAADWVILITSLKLAEFSAADILAQSLIGLKGPPGIEERSARPYVLAHLLAILLLEPFIDELEVSPRLAEAA